MEASLDIYIYRAVYLQNLYKNQDKKFHQSKLKSNEPKRWARKKGRPACASGIIGMISVGHICSSDVVCVTALNSAAEAVISRVVQ